MRCWFYDAAISNGNPYDLYRRIHDLESCLILLVAPLEALTDSRLTDPERRVLLSLFSFRGKDSNTVWPSIESLAERSNINDKTRISKLTKSLSAKGWLTKKRRGFTGGNQYTLTVPTNLDCSANLDNQSNMVEDTNTNLDCSTNTNLDSDTKYKEQTIEHTNEQTNNTSPATVIPYQEISDAYHEILPELPAVKILTDKRKKYIKARWQGSKNAQSVSWWREYFTFVSDSDFLMGRKTDFKADFEWLITEGNFVKVIEGKYHQDRGEQHAKHKQPDKPRSPIERFNARRQAERESNGNALGADAGSLRAQVGNELRPGANGGLVQVINGDYATDDR